MRVEPAVDLALRFTLVETEDRYRVTVTKIEVGKTFAHRATELVGILVAEIGDIDGRSDRGRYLLALRLRVHRRDLGFGRIRHGLPEDQDHPLVQRDNPRDRPANSSWNNVRLVVGPDDDEIAEGVACNKRLLVDFSNQSDACDGNLVVRQIIMRLLSIGRATTQTGVTQQHGLRSPVPYALCDNERAVVKPDGIIGMAVVDLATAEWRARSLAVIVDDGRYPFASHDRIGLRLRGLSRGVSRNLRRRLTQEDGCAFESVMGIRPEARKLPRRIEHGPHE